jgi:TonB-dependent SusC/RagA subfamily outer membrane receptor
VNLILTMSSSREKRRTTACSLLALLIAPALLHSQQSADSTAPAARPVFDRYTIDVAAIVRDGVPRTLSDVLVGQVPGLLVTPGSGLHGSGARIRFAGLQSLLADAPPLVFLDGMQIDGREDDSQIGPGPSRLDDVSVEDVETIDVLRGPASIATYGQGAAAGVILIHTKAGRSGRFRMAGFAQSAMQSIPARWPANYGGVDLDNADPYMRTGACNLQAQASGSCIQDFVQRFNPLVQRSPFSATPDRLVGLSATGGPRWGAFRLAGTFDGEPAAYNIPSVTWSDDIRQWNFHASGEFHPRPNVGLGLSVARTASSLHLANYAPISQGLLGPSDSTGFSWDQGLSPPGLQTIGRTVVNLNGGASLTPWLTLQATLGFDELLQREQQFTSPLVNSTGRRRGGDHTLRFMATVPDRMWRGIRFSSTVGFERLKNHGEELRSIVQQNSSFLSESVDQLRWIGLYGVEQIALRDRVVLTGTLRHDWFHGQAGGQLATGGTHPSIALDWIARPERNGTLGRITMRASYGTSAAVPARVIETFSLVPPLLVQASPPPPPLKPEKTRAFEVGAEATGFAARVRAQLSVYDSRSQAIEPLPPSIPSGGPSPLYVSGVVIGNRGVVASVVATLIDRVDLGWDLHVSLWGNRNRLLEWPGPPTFFSASGIRSTGQLAAVGYPTGGYWARPVTGFSDANGDGIITSNEVTYSQTFQWMGTPYPTQGATLNTSWRLGKRVRVSTLLDYRAGQTLYNRIADFRCEASLCRERNDPTTPLAAQAIAVAAGASPPGYYEDADYLKLREIALAFDVPDRVAAAVGARDATIVLGGRNLATWTGYSGADPEAGSYGVSLIGAPPIIADFGTVPTAREWTLRVRVSY